MTSAKFKYCDLEYTYNGKVYVLDVAGTADVDTYEDFEDGYSRGVSITQINDVEIKEKDVYARYEDVDTPEEEIEQVINDFVNNIDCFDIDYELEY